VKWFCRISNSDRGACEGFRPGCRPLTNQPSEDFEMNLDRRGLLPKNNQEKEL